jgi:hypothetical protein
VGKDHVGREPQCDKIGLGKAKGWGEYVALVTAKFSLEVLPIEVCPLLVGHKNFLWVADDVDVVAIRNDQEVGEILLQFGQGAMDRKREEETSEGTPLFTADGVHYLAEAGAWFKEENAGGVTIHECNEAVNRGKVLEKGLPHLGTTPAVESIFGVKGAVDMVWMEFKVGRDCCSNFLTACSYADAELQGFRLKEERVYVSAQGMECKATKKAEENMTDDYRAEMAFVIFGNNNTSTRIQEGDNGDWH